MNEIVKFDSELSILKTKINAIGEENPAKAYIVSNALEKLGKEQKTVYSDGFKKYVDEYGEIPGPYKVKVSQRTSYAFEEDEEWSRINELLKAREDKLKRAVNASLKGEIMCEESGEIVPLVSIKGTEIYTLTNK